MCISGTSSSRKAENMVVMMPALNAPAAQQAFKTLKQWRKLFCRIVAVHFFRIFRGTKRIPANFAPKFPNIDRNFCNFLTKNNIANTFQSSYSPELPSCDISLYPQLKSPRKGGTPQSYTKKVHTRSASKIRESAAKKMLYLRGQSSYS